MIFEGYSNVSDAWYTTKIREKFEANREFVTLTGERLKEFKKNLQTEYLV
jgi:hypothetical protein